MVNVLSLWGVGCCGGLRVLRRVLLRDFFLREEDFMKLYLFKA
jgi:hypothetical protein